MREIDLKWPENVRNEMPKIKARSQSGTRKVSFKSRKDDDNKCRVCNMKEENIRHVFSECDGLRQRRLQTFGSNDITMRIHVEEPEKSRGILEKLVSGLMLQ